MKDFNSDGVITISDYKELFLAIPNGLWKQLVNSDIGGIMGRETGLEPATTGITIRGSTN